MNGRPAVLPDVRSVTFILVNEPLAEDVVEYEQPTRLSELLDAGYGARKTTPRLQSYLLSECKRT